LASATNGASIAQYTARITCADTSLNPTTGMPYQPAEDLPSNKLLSPGTQSDYSLTFIPTAKAVIACTITNTPNQVLLTKVGADGTTPLPGSQWELAADNAGVPATPALGAPQTPAPPVTPENGTFQMRGLPAGTYWLTEVLAPPGYMLLAQPISFQILPDGTVQLGANAVGVAVVDNSGGVPHITAQDLLVLHTLPATGGSGTRIYLPVGGALVLLAAVIMIAPRRRYPNRPVARS
jgi:LPXTG-motif cell wall-anchored protein